MNTAYENAMLDQWYRFDQALALYASRKTCADFVSMYDMGGPL